MPQRPNGQGRVRDKIAELRYEINVGFLRAEETVSRTVLHEGTYEDEQTLLTEERPKLHSQCTLVYTILVEELE